MTDFLNRVRVLTATTAQGSSIALGAAFSNAFCTPAEAGAVNGNLYTYILEEGNDFEVQVDQAYSSSGPSLARGTPALSKIGGTAGTTQIILAGNATLRIISSKENYASFLQNKPQSFSAAEITQLLANLGWSTGDAKLTIKTTADPGWIIMDDGTIGDGSSAASTRANADCQALFTLIWNNISNTYAPVVGGRGANAAADWAAHKKITLTKQLGRSIAIAGSGSGLTARTLGQTAGAETETPTEAKTAAHAHTQTRYGNSANGIALGGSLSNVWIEEGSANTGSTGSGNALSIMQPSAFWNIMIKL